MSNSTFNVGELAKLAQKLLEERDVGQEYMLSDVCIQTKQAYEQFPEDPVIRQVAFVVERMNERSPKGSTISQSQLSNIHNEVARLSSNSKFRSVLGHFLLDRPQKTANGNNFVQMNRLDADRGIDTSGLVDRTLVENFSTALGGQGTFKTYDQKTAELGAKYVQIELSSLGIKSASIDFTAGSEDTLIYIANFDTNRGQVGVKIPIDLQNGQLIFPSTFISEGRLENLNAANVAAFIERKAHEANPNMDKRAEQSDFIELGAGTQIAGTEQKAELPKELMHLARDFEDGLLEAASIFGRRAVLEGKQIVARELSVFGFKNAQVKFGSESNDSAIYLATINTPKGVIEIEVPVEMQIVSNAYAPLMPVYFAFDGLIEDFTASKLQRFALHVPSPSSGGKAYTSSYNYMTLPELKDEILKSAADNDYVNCETILGYIEEKFNEEDYKNAVADYQYLLITKTSAAKKTQHRCSKMIAAGHGSIYARCGHYLVSMDKVAAGLDGECILKSSIERERLNPVEESGAFISTSKINFT